MALSWAVDAGVASRVMLDVNTECQRVRRRRFRAAITGLILLVCGGLAWQFFPRGSESVSIALSMRNRTPVISLPERRVLSDGSIIELREGAEISVTFDGMLRRIVLARGEAHFDVAPDALRPFAVVADGVEARAVGTAFAMRADGNSVGVVVTEGVIVIKREAESAIPLSTAPNPMAQTDVDSPGALATVGAGHRAVIELSTPPRTPPLILPMTEPEIRETLSWRIPRLDFSRTPLAEVVSMFHQHNRTRIVLAQESLHDVEISGVLRADNVDSLLQLLELEFGIVAERQGEDRILLFGPQR